MHPFGGATEQESRKVRTVIDTRMKRDLRPVAGSVFFAMPYGSKTTRYEKDFDFDHLYEAVYRATVEEAGMTAVRADSIYGPQTVMEPIWRGIQEAEIVVVDFTTRGPNVAMEFGMSYLIGKKMIYLTQDPDDIPTDVRGQVRYIEYSPHFDAVDRLRVELKAQLAAIRGEANVEMTLTPMVSGATVPAHARVVSLTREFVVVETDDGRHGVLGQEDVDYTRIIPDMTRRYGVGERLDGAFEVDPAGGMKYTMLAGQANPWPHLVSAYAPGTVFTGTVENIATAGVFVKVFGGVNGLIPRSALTGRIADLAPGDRVEVCVTGVDTERRRVSLRPDRSRGSTAAAAAAFAVPAAVPTEGFPALGARYEGEVVKAVPEGSGGFALIRLPDRDRPAMLHVTRMTPELRADLNAGGLEIGDVIDVEVIGVEPSRNRIDLRELTEEECDEQE